MFYRFAWCGSRKYILIALCLLIFVYLQKLSMSKEPMDFKLTDKVIFFDKKTSGSLPNFDENDNIAAMASYETTQNRENEIFSSFTDDGLISANAIYGKNSIEKFHKASILEISCKYPILLPEDHSMKQFIKHVRKLKCRNVEPNFINFDQSSRILKFDRIRAAKLYGKDGANRIKCHLRPFQGSLRPMITTISYTAQKTIDFDEKIGPVEADQFEVKCFMTKPINNGTTGLVEKVVVYQNAFAQISMENVKNRDLVQNSEDVLSLDIIGLDSTSLNMFKRHMPSSWRYMTEDMGFLHLEAYNKVADNSMVNWVPTLLGKRYLDQSEDMPNELEPPFPNEPLNLEKFDWLWKKFQKKGCATMMNDDPMHYTRGLFHYPWVETAGFRHKPTDFYFRPWHVYQRKNGHPNATEFCFKNSPYFELQLDLVEKMVEKFANTCHFSFSFLTDLTHDNPSNLELMDDFFQRMLRTLFTGQHLNRTVLLVMGDHGNRIGSIQYTYGGRIEERATFFSIFFPEWFRRKYAHLMENLKINKFRLTSNYDVYQTLQTMVNGRFDADPSPDPMSKGLSLFSKIPANRTCRDANIPENHCLCMVPVQNDARIEAKHRAATVDRLKKTIFEFSVEKLHFGLKQKCASVLNLSIEVSNFTAWTTSQMIQHGVRYPRPEYLDRLKKFAPGDLEFLDVEYKVGWVKFLARVQHDKNQQKMTINIDPLVLSKNCPTLRDLSSFCACSALKNNL